MQFPLITVVSDLRGQRTLTYNKEDTIPQFFSLHISFIYTQACNVENIFGILFIYICVSFSFINPFFI